MRDLPDTNSHDSQQTQSVEAVRNDCASAGSGSVGARRMYLSALILELRYPYCL